MHYLFNVPPHPGTKRLEVGLPPRCPQEDRSADNARAAEQASWNQAKGRLT